MRNNSFKFLEFGQVFQEEMSFHDISYLELWQPVFSMEWSNLCYFGKVLHEKRFCETILNLDQRFRRCHLMTYFI